MTLDQADLDAIRKLVYEENVAQTDREEDTKQAAEPAGDSGEPKYAVYDNGQQTLFSAYSSNGVERKSLLNFADLFLDKWPGSSSQVVEVESGAWLALVFDPKDICGITNCERASGQFLAEIPNYVASGLPCDMSISTTAGDFSVVGERSRITWSYLGVEPAGQFIIDPAKLHYLNIRLSGSGTLAQYGALIQPS